MLIISVDTFQYRTTERINTYYAHYISSAGFTAHFMLSQHESRWTVSDEISCYSSLSKFIEYHERRHSQIEKLEVTKQGIQQNGDITLTFINLLCLYLAIRV